MNELSYITFSPLRLSILRKSFLILVLICTSCVQASPAETVLADVANNAAESESLPKPSVDRLAGASAAQKERGTRLYAQYCAGCHGSKAEGTPTAPSLDGTGHTWHHPWHVLHSKTSNGFRQMPAFAVHLSAAEIDDVIIRFQSLWSPEVYSTWQKRWPRKP